MTVAAVELRQTAIAEPERLPEGIDGFFHGLWRWQRGGARTARRLKVEAEDIPAAAAAFRDLDDAALDERLAAARARFRGRGRGRQDRRSLADGLAVLVEVSARTLGRRPYAVQVMAALALYDGAVAQMATGEGKTLVAGLAATLAAWSGAPCHVVTVNDYLVRRDAALLAPLYRRCGVGVGTVTGDMDPPARRAGYACAVTYATSKDLLADFLRDRLVLGEAREPGRRLLRAALEPRRFGCDALVMSGIHTAIVDEADSVLVDEAITPLIISRTAENALLREGAYAGTKIADGLKRDRDYLVDESWRDVRLTAGGVAALAEAASGLPPLWQGSARREDLIRQALTAKELLLRDQHYVVADGKIVIVDEFTGRMMPGRSWGNGLHQAIEAKEGVPITDPTEVQARMSFQHFFRHYRVLSGLTGTAQGLGSELWRIYGLPVVPIPTHRPCRRRVAPDRLFVAAEAKWQAIEADVAGRLARGQPVLIGTRSIETSEALAARLAGRAIDCRVLNAVRHAEEAAIVAEAGRRGAVTIATNMAGRGTDIALGDGVAGLGGLHVIATERHESRRVDLQLFGRSARQGEPGSVAVYLCFEDALFRRFLPTPLRAIAARLARVPGAAPIMAALAFALQAVAERRARVRRKALLRADHRRQEGLSFAVRDGVDSLSPAGRS